MLKNMIAVSAASGGVGKSTVALELGAAAAAQGIPTLLLELNQQTDLAWALRVRDDPRLASPDLAEGEALARSLTSQADGPVLPLRVIEAVRPNLDYSPGGARLGRQLDLQMAWDRIGAGGRDPSSPQALWQTGRLLRTVATVADRYGLIVADLPPGLSELVVQAHVAAAGVVLVTRADAASLEGLRRHAQAVFADARVANPELALVGVALHEVEVSATRVRAGAIAAIDAIVGTRPTGESFAFGSVVRHAAAAAVDARALGMTAAELADAGDALPADLWIRVRRGELDQAALPRVSTAARGLADDYALLATEILTRFAALHHPAPAPTPA